MKYGKKQNIIMAAVILAASLLFVNLIQSVKANPKFTTERKAVNGADVIAKIRQDAKLTKLYNRPKLRNAQEVSAYIDSRKRVLETLAIADPVKTIDVAISPSEHLNLEDFWKLKSQHHIHINDMSFDVFTDGKWSSMVWVGTDSRLDFDSDAAKVIQQLGDLAPEPVTQMRAFDRNASFFEVRYVRASMAARDAWELQTNPSIRLVDTTEDIREAFSEGSRVVRVIDMPHIYVVENFLTKKVYPQP